MIFEIIINKTIDAIRDFGLIATKLKILCPGLSCYNSSIMLADDSSSADLETDYTWFDISRTNDDLWTSSIHFHYFPDTFRRLDFPAIRISEQISHIYECNCLCDTFDIVSNLDPHDPYWTLAYIKGQWYFADTADMKLMGPYTDGINQMEGSSPLKLLYALDLRNPQKGLYDYNALKAGS